MAELTIVDQKTAALTDVEIKILTDMLATGDRGGFYMVYHSMTLSFQAALQAQIATFSGPGGVAFPANRLDQAAFGAENSYSGIDPYNSVYQYSQFVAKRALEAIAGVSMPAGKKFKLGGHVASFDGQQALGFSAGAMVTKNVMIDAGVGFATSGGPAGVRLGGQVAW